MSKNRIWFFIVFILLLNTGLFSVNSNDSFEFTLNDLSGSHDFIKPVKTIHVINQDKYLVAGKNGTIELLDAKTDSITLLLDIHDRLYISNEQGLLGMTLDKKFDSNGYVYLIYSEIDPSRNLSNCYGCAKTILSRWNMNKDTFKMTPDSEVRLLTIKQFSPFHKGGNLVFGPDGLLYINIGDDLHGSQDLTSYFGTILRINTSSIDTTGNYTIPTDNPFVNNTKGYLEEIYAYGLRNPWRSSFDEQTGTFWAGDAGETLYEEINLIEKGSNYGWKIMEGFECYKAESCNKTGLVDPLYVYPHEHEEDDQIWGVAVIGGFVYRGSDFPQLQGKYIYADWNGKVFSMDYDFENEEVGSVEVLFETDNIAAIDVDQDGELLFNFHNTGKVSKLTSEADTGGPGIFNPKSENGFVTSTFLFTTIAAIISVRKIRSGLRKIW